MSDEVKDPKPDPHVVFMERMDFVAEVIKEMGGWDAISQGVRHALTALGASLAMYSFFAGVGWQVVLLVVGLLLATIPQVWNAVRRVLQKRGDAEDAETTKPA